MPSATVAGASARLDLERSERQTPSPAASRLQAALDRIAGALVRRAEAEAASLDALAADAASRAAQSAPPGLDDAVIDDIRDRLDVAIFRLRAALDEHEKGSA